jgi:hypothetical protein
LLHQAISTPDNALLLQHIFLEVPGARGRTMVASKSIVKKARKAPGKKSSKTVSTTSLTVPTCGMLHAIVNAAALPDNGMPPHQEHYDRTFDIPIGSHNYGNPNTGLIVSQGYPNNGGSHSWAYLSSVGTVIDQGQNPASVRLNLTTTADLDSGVGRGTGAGSDFDTEWFLLTSLPSGKWNLLVAGVINGSNCSPSCTIRVNNGQPEPITKTGPFIHVINGLSGTNAIFVSISQGHLAIFPNGPTHSTTRATVNSDISLSFSRA